MDFMKRDSYNKLDYIDATNKNNIKYIEQDKKLHDSMKETSDLLDIIFLKNKITEQIMSGKF